MTMLALDQSSQLLGWAKGFPDMGAPEVGTFGLPTLCGPNGEDECGAVAGQVRQFLRDQFQDPLLTHVFYESIYFDKKKGNPETYGQLYLVKGIIRLTCIDHSRTCVEVTPGEWRETFLGFRDSRALKGTDDSLKDAARARCKKLGWSVANEHEAEAAGILSWGLTSRFADYAARTDPSPLFQRRDQ